MQPYQTARDFLSDDQTLELVHATTGQRFLNLFIDVLITRLLLEYLAGASIGYLAAQIDPDFAYDFFVAGSNSWGTVLFNYIVGSLIWLLYYSLCEKLFKGRTLGKLITATRAVRTDGAELTGKDAILRSLYRIIPFEAFSGFGGHPWHDTKTGTMVVQAK